MPLPEYIPRKMKNRDHKTVGRGIRDRYSCIEELNRLHTPELVNINSNACYHSINHNHNTVGRGIRDRYSCIEELNRIHTPEIVIIDIKVCY